MNEYPVFTMFRNHIKFQRLVRRTREKLLYALQILSNTYRSGIHNPDVLHVIISETPPSRSSSVRSTVIIMSDEEGEYEVGKSRSCLDHLLGLKCTLQRISHKLA